MKLFWILLYTHVSLFIYSQEQKFIQGKVYNDINQNGVLDVLEPGIANVLVSNQKDVVVTDIDGNYSLPVDEQTIIFITKPNDYNVPLDCNNLPQFFYIHQPGGSPELEYEGIEPTGNLPGFINFPLYKSTKKDTFNLLVFADVQVANQVELEYFREDVITNVLNNNLNVDISLSLGDLVHDNLSLYPDYIKSMALLKIPNYNVQGNHDVNYDTDEKYSSETFKKYFGPNYYSFDYGNVHFICLDNIERFCSKKNTPKWWDCYTGNIAPKQFEWLKNDLKLVAENKLIVISQHIPFQESLETDINGREIIKNQKELFELFKQKENILILAGHRHLLQHCYFNKLNGWYGKKELHQIVCSSVSGTWWSGPKNEEGIPLATQTDGVPNGFFLIEFQDNKYIHQFYPAGNNLGQIRIESPKGIVNEKDTKKIIVNVYNSNKYSKVFATIDNGAVINLANENMEDPYIKTQFSKYKDSYKSWVTPSTSDHIWVADFQNKKKGLHVLKLTFIDEYDQKNNVYSIFEIK